MVAANARPFSTLYFYLFIYVIVYSVSYDINHFSLIFSKIFISIFHKKNLIKTNDFLLEKNMTHDSNF